MADDQTFDYTGLTADIVSAMVSNNEVAADDLPQLITTVHKALSGLGKPAAPVAPVYEPAVSVRKSLANPDKIISLIDGKPYSMLKRHLGQHGLTPAEYRERYNLPKDYPMIAPAYAERRRSIAKEIGLGVKRAVETVATVVEEAVAPRRGRPRKAEGAPAAPAATGKSSRRKPAAADALKSAKKRLEN